jgi:hypothetical protein
MHFLQGKKGSGSPLVRKKGEGEDFNSIYSMGLAIIIQRLTGVSGSPPRLKHQAEDGNPPEADGLCACPQERTLTIYGSRVFYDA